MKLLPRMAFRCMEPPRHIHVPIFDPQRHSDELLLVNFTTLRDTCIDDACVLHHADYPELTHATTVAYSRAITGKKSAFIRAVTAGHFIQLEDLPAATWDRIIEGARRSPELSDLRKKILPPE